MQARERVGLGEACAFPEGVVREESSPSIT